MAFQLSRQAITISRRAFSTSLVKSQSAKAPALSQEQVDSYYPKIGNRDVVGFGFNGNPNYQDRPEFPAPAVRWAPNTDEVLALRQKESGDWKKLSMDEKKALYRASFRHTFAEMKAPTGEWKSIAAGVLLGCSVAGWFMVWLKLYVYPALPVSITDEWKEDMLEKAIKQQQNPIEGIASKYDYENDRWKN